jgi:hypothetical protein
LSGTVADISEGQIAIVVEGGGKEPVSYAVDAAASIVRDGQTVTFDKIDKGDHAVLTIDGSTKQVTNLVVEPAPNGGPRIELFLVGGVGLLGLVVAKRRLSVEPFIVKHIPD